ncbi:MAG: hypothetical protein CVU09_00115 [Bacteroidetes bacterium HGW-Bacteroidetes-4]|jgi:hypothetical protein|nr:MAG: hypothetical protein CVU09_00115 [Bacteroidetes bacterium HGW-Bacteroidetes-4]
MEAKQTLELFLRHAIKGHARKAKKYVQITQLHTSQLVDSNIERINLTLKGAGKITLVERESVKTDLIPSKCLIDFKLVTEKKGEFTIRLIKESGIRKPDENGTWGVNVTSFKIYTV